MALSKIERKIMLDIVDLLNRRKVPENRKLRILNLGFNLSRERKSARIALQITDYLAYFTEEQRINIIKSSKIFVKLARLHKKHPFTHKVSF